MKNLTKILCAVAILFAVACSKDGATGPQGPAGTNGTNGTDGNANVTLYTFNTAFVLTSASSTKSFTLTGMTQSGLDSSLVLGYFHQSSCNGSVTWYPMAGIGCSNLFQSKSYVSSSLSFRIYDVDGSSYSGANQTFDKVKIVVIPASTVISGRTRDPRTMSYEEVCKAYNIKDDK